MSSPKVLLVLFDGAEWNVIHPLLRAGRLPHLAALMRAGTHGPLQSLEDVALASPILWTSMATGKLPHKHGVKDFYDTASSVRSARIWEIFEHEKLPIGLFGHLVTWPPHETNGFIVPDWCARTSEAFPADLNFINTMNHTKNWRGLIRNGAESWRHGMRFATALVAAKEVLREKLLNQTRLDLYFSQRLLQLAFHADFFLWLLRRHHPYFACFYSGLPDAVHHQYWKFMEPEKFHGVSPKDVQRYGSVIGGVYEKLDEKLGRLLRHVGSETLVVLASDHGGEANVEEEYRWAEVRAENLLHALGVNGNVSVFRIGPRSYFRLRHRSDALNSIRGLAEQVCGVVLASSRVPIFQVEVNGEEEMSVEVIYLKDSVDGAQLRLPDGRQFPIEQFLNLSQTISGRHSMYGVFALRGPHVRKGHEITGASLLDVTPTILALLGRPVAKDMDGKVLTDAIAPDFLRRHPVQFIESYDSLLGKEPNAEIADTEVGMEEVKERLRELGYLE